MTACQPRHARPRPGRHVPRRLAFAAVAAAAAAVPASSTGELPVPAQDHTGPLPRLTEERVQTTLLSTESPEYPIRQGWRPGYLHLPRPRPARRSRAAAPAPVTLDSRVARADTGLEARVAGLAVRFQGYPYSWGGTGPGSFDCSGFLLYLYGRLGIKIPRVSEDQYLRFTPVSQALAVPGDPVFFLSGRYSYHTGIYLGVIHGVPTMVSALSLRYGVKVTPLSWGGSVYAFGRWP